MAMKLGVVLFLLGLAKDASTEGFSRRALPVPGPDCYISTQPECSWKREAVGCFNDKVDQRALPELLYTAKDPNSAVYFGEKINWLEWANFIDKFTCACAIKARNKRFNYFGIEYYGECWGGRDVQYSVHGPSGRCEMIKPNECTFEVCDQQRNDSRLCVGGPRALFVFAIKKIRPSTMPPTQPPTKGPSTMPPTQPPTKGPTTMPPPTQTPTKAPRSCKEIYEDNQQTKNKAYMLQVGSVKRSVYCNMDGAGLGKCGGGGWTMVMKTDGSKQTFHYDSRYWTDKNEYGVPEGETGLDRGETKLATYWNTPFTKICLGMATSQEGPRFIVLNQTASSLFALVGDGNFHATTLGRNEWKELIGPSQASLQLNCNREGFNVQSDATHSKARIGIINNQENDCRTCDSRIGFGTGGKHDNSNTCGNEATHSPDNGNKHIKAFGYILVQ